MNPPEQAVINGHNLEYDPPHALSAVRRWTCKTCGDAALVNGRVEYGSAIENACAGGGPRKAADR